MKEKTQGNLSSIFGSSVINSNTYDGSALTATNNLYNQYNPYSGGYVATTGTNVMSITISNPYTTFSPVRDEVVKYIDMICMLLDIDMDYNRFIKMTEDERKSFTRDIIIQKITS